MTYPNYFKKLPTLNYLTTINPNGTGNYKQVVNIFSKLNMEEDIFKFPEFYIDYTIADGYSPEDVANEVYGDSGLYWLILTVNNIYDCYSHWPMSSERLEKYIIDKYGSWNAADATKLYKTVETYNAVGDLVLPGGIIVASNYVFYYHPDPNNKQVGPGGGWVELSSLPVATSYADYEIQLNESKRNIRYLNKKYLNDYMRLMDKKIAQLPEETTSEFII